MNGELGSKEREDGRMERKMDGQRMDGQRDSREREEMPGFSNAFNLPRICWPRSHGCCGPWPSESAVCLPGIFCFPEERWTKGKIVCRGCEHPGREGCCQAVFLPLGHRPSQFPWAEPPERHRQPDPRGAVLHACSPST